ncbi:type I methionyl aminopeptidase [Actinokineospora diospyrosa]|uniref:Methionine aminopeptidase n=1 Tax=Actinokineospora diospyrosa TaxID=103728 RepID=A0ABT1I8F4_9PSEU|nr:type I methionyl aminopeptidase [Actinokineospora diospyrosa]MCP2268914.1 methionine aminopeptidase, type I (EC 3.4.11.18) [Actinokineospora diospyrosa]
MIELKTAAEVAAMREAGRIVGEALDRVRAAAGVGVTLLELDAVAREVLAEHKAGSSFLGYQPGFADSPFPAVLCTSVNDAIVHGIPTATPLRDGDLLSIDFGAHLNGWHGDAARSFVVGTPDPADLKLIETAERALAAAIAAATPGNRLGDIGHAIATVVRGAGYGIPPDFGGHGIGRAMHESPSVPNEARAGRGMRLRPGLVIAIEPMLHAGADPFTTDPDGWTLRTVDGSRAAHVENTVAITEDGPVVLTTP